MKELWVMYSALSVREYQLEMFTYGTSESEKIGIRDYEDDISNEDEVRRIQDGLRKKKDDNIRLSVLEINEVFHDYVCNMKKYLYMEMNREVYFFERCKVSRTGGVRVEKEEECTDFQIERYDNNYWLTRDKSMCAWNGAYIDWIQKCADIDKWENWERVDDSDSKESVLYWGRKHKDSKETYDDKFVKYKRKRSILHKMKADCESTTDGTNDKTRRGLKYRESRSNNYVGDNFTWWKQKLLDGERGLQDMIYDDRIFLTWVDVLKDVELELEYTEGHLATISLSRCSASVTEKTENDCGSTTSMLEIETFGKVILIGMLQEHWETWTWIFEECYSSWLSLSRQLMERSCRHYTCQGKSSSSTSVTHTSNKERKQKTTRWWRYQRRVETFREDHCER